MYAKLKVSHNFHIDLDALKAFITILLISGYIDLPRRPMFSKSIKDVQNIAVSSRLPRNRFDELMQDLYLANNSSLDPNNNFDKVRPIIKN